MILYTLAGPPCTALQIPDPVCRNVPSQIHFYGSVLDFCSRFQPFSSLQGVPLHEWDTAVSQPPGRYQDYRHVPEHHQAEVTHTGNREDNQADIREDIQETGYIQDNHGLGMAYGRKYWSQDAYGMAYRSQNGYGRIYGYPDTYGRTYGCQDTYDRTPGSPDGYDRTSQSPNTYKRISEELPDGDTYVSLVYGYVPPLTCPAGQARCRTDLGEESCCTLADKHADLQAGVNQGFGAEGR